MAIIQKRVCDRCGKELKFLGWTAKIFGLSRKVFIRKLYNGNPDGYSYYDFDYELCHDCTRKLEKFMRCENEPR